MKHLGSDEIKNAIFAVWARSVDLVLDLGNPFLPPLSRLKLTYPFSGKNSEGTL